MTDFEAIQFNKQHHSYTYNGKRLKSVTSRVYQLKPPFDPDGTLAEKKAREAGVTVEVIKAQWEEKRQKSMDHGTRVHEKIAQILRGEEPPQDDFTASAGELPEITSFRSVLEQFKSRRMRVEKVEWVVGDEVLGLGGTVDTVVYAMSTRKYHVIDWKTGSFTTENKFGKLLEPFSDLDDCYFSTYCLQLALYRAIIKRNTDLPMGNSYIYHLTPEGTAQAYLALDFTERVVEWAEGLTEPGE